jgi:hypothetical protein
MRDIPEEAFRDIEASVATYPIRLGCVGMNAPDLTKLEKTPAFFWMISEGNDRKTQINAGRAYVRAQLAATKHGLSMQPISQALQEYPEQAKPYAQIHQLLDAPVPRYTVQMWARLGYAPIIGPSPRRGLSEHFVS